MSETLREGMLLSLGNPLLDISVCVGDDSLLGKYNLQPNDAILAQDQHKLLYEEITTKYVPEYIAGGSAQNAVRIAQTILKKPNVLVYMGCVGKDKYSEILQVKAKEVGLKVYYQYIDNESTGTCAVIITQDGKCRSLCANLAAANLFTTDHLNNPENAKYINEASFYYIEGFFVTVNIEAILKVAKVSLQNNSTLMLNLSARFICQFFGKQLSEVMPYVDILFGNNDEAFEYVKYLGHSTNDIEEAATFIASLPKENPQKKRIVIFTQGDKPVIVAKGGNVQQFPINYLPKEQIVDTNGAGDAFVGGYISQLLVGHPLDICIKCGNSAACEVIKNSGCTMGKDFVFQP